MSRSWYLGLKTRVLMREGFRELALLIGQLTYESCLMAGLLPRLQQA